MYCHQFILRANLQQDLGSDEDDRPARGHHREAKQRDWRIPGRRRGDGVVLEGRRRPEAGAKEVTAAVGINQSTFREILWKLKF